MFRFGPEPGLAKTQVLGILSFDKVKVEEKIAKSV
jgi:hypothetical protein